MQTYDIHIDRSGRELTRHGSAAFPLAVYTTTVSKNVLGFIDWHWHDELQFCLVIKDSIRVAVEGDSFVLGEGEGLFVNSRRLHSITNAPGADATYICLDFHPRLAYGFDGSAVQAKFMEPHISKEAVPYLKLQQNEPWAAEVIGLLRRVYSSYSSPAPDELQIAIWLMSAWRDVVERLQAGADGSRAAIRPQVRGAMEYVGEHLDEAISLDDVADHVGFAKSTCCREFKRQLGCTLTEYVLNARLQKASRLLLSTDASVAEVASRCGFSSSSYFITKFKARIGTSPAAYRKDHASEHADVLQTLQPLP